MGSIAVSGGPVQLAIQNSCNRAPPTITALQEIMMDIINDITHSATPLSSCKHLICLVTNSFIEAKPVGKEGSDKTY